MALKPNKTAREIVKRHSQVLGSRHTQPTDNLLVTYMCRFCAAACCWIGVFGVRRFQFRTTTQRPLLGGSLRLKSQRGASRRRERVAEDNRITVQGVGGVEGRLECVPGCVRVCVGGVRKDF